MGLFKSISSISLTFQLYRTALVETSRMDKVVRSVACLRNRKRSHAAGNICVKRVGNTAKQDTAATIVAFW